MSTFQDYLTEAVKSYDYKIKVAGEIDKDFGSKLESALAKFEVANMSAGKKTPIMTLPLDFPALSNEQVTIFDVTTNYPASSNVMKEYLSDILRVPATHIVVRKPGEPTEEYQDNMAKQKDESEFKSVLQDVEYKDTPELPKEKAFGDEANKSLFKELLKDRKEKVEAEKKEPDQKHMDKDEKGTPSP